MKYLDHDTGEFHTFEWKTPHNHDTNAESDRYATRNFEKTKTQQHEERTANINNIVEQFKQTGLLPSLQLPPLLDDFADIFDPQTALNTIAAARHAFMQLPPEVRDAFYGDPANFVANIDMMLNEPNPKIREENLAQLRMLNLAVEPGPVADKTTLGDLLKAFKERSKEPEGAAPPSTPKPA